MTITDSFLNSAGSCWSDPHLPFLQWHQNVATHRARSSDDQKTWLDYLTPEGAFGLRQWGRAVKILKWTQAGEAGRVGTSPGLLCTERGDAHGSVPSAPLGATFTHIWFWPGHSCSLCTEGTLISSPAIHCDNARKWLWGRDWKPKKGWGVGGDERSRASLNTLAQADELTAFQWAWISPTQWTPI